MHTLALIHTGFVVVEPINKIVEEVLPGIRVLNLVDDSIIPEIRNRGKITPEVIQRVCNYTIGMKAAGADVILITCSSISPVVDIVKSFVDIPVLKIDEPMAEEAVKKGEVIGVVATSNTTLKPTTDLLTKKAIELKKKIKLKTVLCKDAFDAILSGKTDLHDRLVREEIEKISKDVDIIVLAQASMARIISVVEKDIDIPILCSPRLAIEKIKRIIKN